MRESNSPTSPCEQQGGEDQTQEESRSLASNGFCQSCVTKRVSCCADNHKIPLMMEDVKRISSLGHDPGQFVTVRRYDLNPADHESWWAKGFLKINGGYYRLSMKCVDGACLFLKGGCALGPDRPYVCRIYPFWIDGERNLVYDDDAHDCTIVKEIADLNRGLGLIRETTKSVTDLWRAIKVDLAVNQEEHDELVRYRLGQDHALLDQERKPQWI